MLIIVVVLAYTMLHTKCHCHPPTGSGEEYFFKVITIYGRGSHFGHESQHILRTFRSPRHSEAVHETWLLSARRRLKLLTDGRTTVPAYPISFPVAFGSGDPKWIKGKPIYIYLPSVCSISPFFVHQCMDKFLKELIPSFKGSPSAPLPSPPQRQRMRKIKRQLIFPLEYPYTFTSKYLLASIMDKMYETRKIRPDKTRKRF